MPTSITKPAEIGFAEFTAQLISETLNAVLTSLVQQEKKLREMEMAASLELDDFASLYITEDALRDEILRLFPSPEGGDAASSIDVGAIYKPSSEAQAEDPPVFLLTGYRMAREDYTMERGTRTFRINRPGHDKLSNLIRQSMATAYKNTMEVLIKKGMPRIVVDHGKINTKLSFYLAKAEEETKPKLPFWSGAKTMLPRITVKPLNVRAPEVLGLKASVAGEIEVTFKTISE